MSECRKGGYFYEKKGDGRPDRTPLDWDRVSHRERGGHPPVRKRRQCRRWDAPRPAPPCSGGIPERSNRPPAPSCNICYRERYGKARSCNFVLAKERNRCG